MKSSTTTPIYAVLILGLLVAFGFFSLASEGLPSRLRGLPPYSFEGEGAEIIVEPIGECAQKENGSDVQFCTASLDIPRHPEVVKYTLEIDVYVTIACGPIYTTKSCLGFVDEKGEEHEHCFRWGVPVPSSEEVDEEELFMWNIPDWNNFSMDMTVANTTIDEKSLTINGCMWAYPRDREGPVPTLELFCWTIPIFFDKNDAGEGKEGTKIVRLITHK